MLELETAGAGGDYSMRRPEIALAMTSCWISLVPSKIVWFRCEKFAASTFRMAWSPPAVLMIWRARLRMV